MDLFLGGIRFSMIDLIKYPVITEKSSALLEQNEYTFDVDLRVTKTQMKQFLQDFFEVKVESINSHRSPRKKRRMGPYQGYRPRYKRMMVKLRKGDSLPISKSA